jgi:hypothetical protein
MQVFLDRLRLERRILLRRLCRIELPHDRFVNPVRALEHAAGLIGVPPPTQIGMAIGRPRRRTARRQDMHLVEVACDLHRRFVSLRGCGLSRSCTFTSRSASTSLPALGRDGHVHQAHTHRDETSRHARGQRNRASLVPSPSSSDRAKFSFPGDTAFRKLPDDPEDAVVQLDVFRGASLIAVAGHLRGARAPFITFPMFAVKSCRVVPFRARSA